MSPFTRRTLRRLVRRHMRRSVYPDDCSSSGGSVRLGEPATRPDRSRGQPPPSTDEVRMDDLTPPPDHSEQQWMLKAHCRSLAASAFFPSDGVGVDRARKICAQCEVQPDCLEYALTYRIEH